MAFYQNTPFGPQYYQPSGPFYESTPPSASYSPIFGWSGGWQFAGGGGGYTPPNTTPVASNIVSGYGLQDVGEGMYYYPTADKYFSGEKFYTKSGNQYSPYEEDIKGFNRAGETGIYSPSQAYLSTLNRTPFQQYATQQAPLQSMGYNPALGLSQGTGLYQPASTGLYQPAIGNLLSSPTSMSTPTGNYGAGRFLGGTDGLLGSMPLNFGLPSGESDNG